MAVALNQNLRKILLRITIALMAGLCCYSGVKAQPARERFFRVRGMAQFPAYALIRGFAPNNVTIKVYRSDPATCTPIGDAIATDDTGTSGGFAFSGAQFLGPHIVTMTQNGTEVQESLTLNEDEFQITQPDCSGPATISLWYNQPDDGFTYIWRNQDGNQVGTNSSKLENIGPGTYTLEYTNISGCVYRSVPLTINGIGIPDMPPLIQLECGELEHLVSGRYTGSGSGSYTFRWQDQNGNAIGDTQDKLLKAGVYYFTVINSTGCASPRTKITIKAATSPVINTTLQKQKNASCGQKDGSITGIDGNSAIPGDVLHYKWTNQNMQEFHVKELLNVPSGQYTLTLSSDLTTCPASLPPIDLLENNNITVQRTEHIANTQCGLDNGSITNITTNATRFRWVNEKDTNFTVTSTLDLLNAAPGFYRLYLGDESNCTRIETGFHVMSSSRPVTLITEPTIINDKCNLGTGSITGAKFSGTIKSYTWYDAQDKMMARNGDLTNAPAGRYRLQVELDNCESTFFRTIENEELSITPPVMDSILVCDASTVLGSFKETADTYRIYDADGVLLNESKSKDFKIDVAHPGNFYAALARGTCESPRTEFNIRFGSSGLDIPSAFSPNGDGQNDKWIIRGLDAYLSPEIKIFNRQGNMVFHAIGSGTSFDGKENGKDLPVGVYYYIVKASTECPAASGSLTLIR